MNLLAALEGVRAGRAIRREIWPAAVTAKLVLVDGEERLMIWDEGQFHPWTISRSDLDATDWVAAGAPAPAKQPGRPPRIVPVVAKAEPLEELPLPVTFTPSADPDGE